MGVSGQAALRTEDWGQKGCLDTSLGNFRGPAVYGDKVQAMTMGMSVKVEWKRPTGMKKSRN